MYIHVRKLSMIQKMVKTKVHGNTTLEIDSNSESENMCKIFIRRRYEPMHFKHQKMKLGYY